jgi:hypothetical protein
VLVEHGADYKAVNNDGETAEQAARQHGKTAAAEVLAAWAKDPKCEVVACCHEVFILLFFFKERKPPGFQVLLASISRSLLAPVRVTLSCLLGCSSCAFMSGAFLMVLHLSHPSHWDWSDGPIA